MAKQIIIKPIISEKSELLSEASNKYSFVVSKNANKIEIGKEIERLYGVDVESVNTMIVASKNKTRNTRTGIQKGKKSSYKKAIISVAQGDVIDLYGAEE